MDDVTGLTAVVTGGAGGIGRHADREGRRRGGAGSERRRGWRVVRRALYAAGQGAVQR